MPRDFPHILSYFKANSFFSSHENSQPKNYSHNIKNKERDKTRLTCVGNALFHYFAKNMTTITVMNTAAIFGKCFPRLNILSADDNLQNLFVRFFLNFFMLEFFAISEWVGTKCVFAYFISLFFFSSSFV